VLLIAAYWTVEVRQVMRASAGIAVRNSWHCVVACRYLGHLTT